MFATLMVERGMHQVALQKLMGHEEIAVTMKYYVSFSHKMKEDALRILEGKINWGQIGDKTKEK